MRLLLLRRWRSPRSTVGQLYVDGIHECYTLEDVDRGLASTTALDAIARIKVPGQTAVPHGHYRVALDMSPRFQAVLPHVLDVPGFTGIRIHAGNTEADTDGCILVGMLREPERVVASRVALDNLMAKLRHGLLLGEVWLTIKPGEEAAVA